MLPGQVSCAIVAAAAAWRESLLLCWSLAHLVGCTHPLLTGFHLPADLVHPLPGEMRETVQLGGLGGYLFNSMVPQEARARLFRSWGSVLSMLPVGGSKVRAAGVHVSGGCTGHMAGSGT